MAAEARAALLRSCDKIRASCGPDIQNLLDGLESKNIEGILSTCEAAAGLARGEASRLLEKSNRISTDADDVTAAVALVREKKAALDKSKAEREAKKREARALLLTAATGEVADRLEEEALTGRDRPQQLAGCSTRACVALKIECEGELGAANTEPNVDDIGSEENQANTQQQNSVPAGPVCVKAESGSSGAATASAEGGGTGGAGLPGDEGAAAQCTSEGGTGAVREVGSVSGGAGGEQLERGNEGGAAGGGSDMCIEDWESGTDGDNPEEDSDYNPDDHSDDWESGTDGDNPEEDSDYNPDDHSDGDSDVNPAEDEVGWHGSPLIAKQVMVLQ